MTVIRQGMAHEAQLAASLAFAVQPGVRVSCRFMYLVGARLALEAAAPAGLVAAIFAYKALVACPGLDEGAVHAEVFAREPVVLVGHFEHMVEQLNDRVMRDQAFAVLGKYCGHPDGIIHGQPDEPAKQQVVLGLCSMSWRSDRTL